ncbi:MAG TPA: hypothetical protein VIW28_11020 [Gemmatimonadales bacterium]
MSRVLHLTGWVYVAMCAWVLAGALRGRRPERPPEPHGTAPQFGGSAAEWFAAMKPYCNAVEVEIQQQRHPAPHSLEGTGFSAACYALAGKIDSARVSIDRLPAGERPRAAGIVFEIGHPVADAGDDRSAGPIMELVLDYWPNNYMALYHAGMSEYSLGQPELSRTHLRSFLQLYTQDDGWRRNALEVLGRLGTE